MNFERRNLSCKLDSLTPQQRNDRRLNILNKMELLGDKVIPIFDEATQMAANFLQTPICILGVMINDEFCLKSAIGLSQLGLMNEIAIKRKIPSRQSFSSHVVDSQSLLVIENTHTDPFFYRTKLTQHYGICAYLGAPLITPEGECIGSLEVMDLVVRKFSEQECNFLRIISRWCLAEYERSQLLIRDKQQNYQEENQISLPKNQVNLNNKIPEKPEINTDYTKNIINNLIASLIKKLSNPLTLIIGMASVLKGEIYGHLSLKQKEYIEIIYNSGQDISLLITEILDLDNWQDRKDLQLSSFDLQAVIKKVVNSLGFLAKKYEQAIELSIDSSNRNWKLDKHKIQQTVYYLLTTIIESSTPGGEIQIHISHREHQINFTFWVRHPWLGQENWFHNAEIYLQIVSRFYTNQGDVQKIIIDNYSYFHNIIQSGNNNNISAFLFSCYLAKLQGGKINFKGSSEAGYRFVLSIPSLER